MDWIQILTLIIEAVSALATVAAVLVALYQTKYADRIRLKIRYNYEICIKYKTKKPFGLESVKCINIEIINLSSRKVVFDSIKVHAGKKYFFTIQSGRSFCTCNIHGKEIETNMGYNIEAYLIDIKEDLAKFKDNIKLKKKLIFIIKTSSGKKMKVRTNYKVKELLNTPDIDLVSDISEQPTI